MYCKTLDQVGKPESVGKHTLHNRLLSSFCDNCQRFINPTIDEKYDISEAADMEWINYDLIYYIFK